MWGRLLLKKRKLIWEIRFLSKSVTVCPVWDGLQTLPAWGSMCSSLLEHWTSLSSRKVELLNYFAKRRSHLFNLLNVNWLVWEIRPQNFSNHQQERKSDKRDCMSDWPICQTGQYVRLANMSDWPIFQTGQYVRLANTVQTRDILTNRSIVNVTLPWNSCAIF